jgi:hypothetical protein
MSYRSMKKTNPDVMKEVVEMDSDNLQLASTITPDFDASIIGNRNRKRHKK